MSIPRQGRRSLLSPLLLVSLTIAGLVGCAPEPATQQTAMAAVPEPRATLAFAGDVHFEGVSASTGGLGSAFSVLEDADVAVVNLETAVSRRGERAAKEYAFRAPPTAMTALAAAGVDAVTVANNHGMDYGRAALTDTLSAGRDSSLRVLGAGDDEQAALAPWRTAPHGVQVSVLAATDVLDDPLAAAWTATPRSPGLASAKDERRLLQAVRTEAERSDVVVVYLHWGAERQVCATERQQQLARRLAGAGADVVVGSHAHVLQPAARVDGALVAYGLGNFQFYATQEPYTRTGVMTVTVSPRGVVEHAWAPASIVGGHPELLTGADAAERSDELSRLCPSSGGSPGTVGG